ncbi:MAG: DUF3306 domain-containing protein [Stellaceae bacterium]
MAEPADFLARWSQLKRRARRPQPRDAAPANTAVPAPTAEPPPETLPPVESLTVESDYAAFMRPGVPEATRNAALQKLWRSDPVFANLDGLVEYGEDFAAVFKSTAAVRTVYRVLKGLSGKEELATPDSPQSAAPAANKAAGDASPAIKGSSPSVANDGSDSI